MIPIKTADEASTGFVIYQYHRIHRVGDDNLCGKERFCLRYNADLHPQGIDKLHRKTLTQTGLL